MKREESDDEADEGLGTPSIREFFLAKPKSRAQPSSTSSKSKMDLSLFGGNLESLSKLDQLF